MSGGMIQTKRKDGTWQDAFVVGSYRSLQSARNVSAKNHCHARIVSKSGQVIYSTEQDEFLDDLRKAMKH